MPKKPNKLMSLEGYRCKWGVPDWRDASAYPKVEQMGDRAWRWEFLRRREDYRRDWERAIIRWSRDHSQNQKVTKTAGQGSADIYSLVSFERCKNQPDIAFVIQAEDAKRYGLMGMVDPRCTDGFLRFSDTLGFFRPGQTVEGCYWALGLNPWVSDAVHIENLKNLLGIMRGDLNWDGMAKAHRENWPAYLRIIDARADSTTEPASYAEIGEVLRPDDLVYSPGAYAKQAHNQAIAVMKRLTTLEIS